MIIYIHGFGGSGEGVKAKIVRNHFKEEGVLTPSLSYVPYLAVSTLINLIVLFKEKEEIHLIGSSLGGYYALYLGDYFNLKAVLINPSIHPYRTLAPWTGQARNFYDESTFEWNDKHVEMLKRYEVRSVNDQTKIMLMLQTGDDLLDYRQAVKKLPHAQTVIEEGGSHSFDYFETKLGIIENFLIR